MEMLHAGLAPLNCESRRVNPPPPMLRVFNPPPLSRQAFRIPAILLNDRSKKISNA